MNTLMQMCDQYGVLVAAHRGVAAANIPCNTIPAFEIAVRGGARILEMDLFKSTDGQIYIFHTGKEPYQLRQSIDVTKLNSEEIEALRLVNVDANPTRLGLDRFDDVLDQFKGRSVLLNLDRCAGFLKDVVECVERHGMKNQILLKTAPTPDALHEVELYASDYMYMPIYMEEDTATHTIEKMNIRFVGAELVFKTEQSPVIQEAYIELMKKKGLVLWGNSLVYNWKVPLAAGHNDDISMIEDPDNGWGWLAGKGFGIIQTDWALQCVQYCREKKYSY